MVTMSYNVQILQMKFKMKWSHMILIPQMVTYNLVGHLEPPCCAR